VGHGIYLIQGTSNNVMRGNTIAYNALGIRVADGVGNTMAGNSIFSNTSLTPGGARGINLGYDEVTGNDAGDGDGGPNNQQNFPTILSTAAGKIAGTLNSSASSSFTLEFFWSPTADASGYGEGKTPLGTVAVNTDALGNAAFSFTPGPIAAAGVITATATDSAGNTSEFSAAVPIAATTGAVAPATLTATATSGFATHLAWGPVAGADGYHVERSTAGGTFVDIATVTSNSFDDTHLTPGTRYSYRVRAAVGGVALPTYSPTASTMTFLPGDVNGDYRIDFFDISDLLASKYNTGQPATWAEGDQNGDGVVDFFDLTEILSGHYNTGPYGP
jgi:titin